MHLLLNKALINGEWVSATSNEELQVLNPANGSVIGSVPDLSVDDVNQAINAAHTAFHSNEWGSLTAKERSGLLKVRIVRSVVSNGGVKNICWARDSTQDKRLFVKIRIFIVESFLEMVAIVGEQSK